MSLTLRVNGVSHDVDAEPWESLLFVLRERLALYATKNACEEGECGSCSVLMDSQLVCACLVMVFQAEGGDIRTLEGLSEDPVAIAVQEALVACGGVQCGFCTPGFVVAACALLAEEPHPTESQVREHLSGNLCRCTGYGKIVEAVQDALPAGERRP